MKNTYDIQPISVGAGLTTKTATKIFLKGSHSPGDTSMPFSYQLTDDSFEGIYSGFDTLGEDVLAGWGTDDSYIIQAMATKVGVVLV